MEAWNEAQAEYEYVHGTESYGTLAARWGMDVKAVREAGLAGRWHYKRLAFRQGLAMEPLEILREASVRLCRCAGQAARDLDSRAEPLGKGDLKTLHEAVSLVKDLSGLIANLYGEKEETNEEIVIRMEGDLDSFCH